jgi:hypothetical protein
MIKIIFLSHNVSLGVSINHLISLLLTKFDDRLGLSRQYCVIKILFIELLI